MINCIHKPVDWFLYRFFGLVPVKSISLDTDPYRAYTALYQYHIETLEDVLQNTTLFQKDSDLKQELQAGTSFFADFKNKVVKILNERKYVYFSKLYFKVKEFQSPEFNLSLLLNIYAYAHLIQYLKSDYQEVIQDKPWIIDHCYFIYTALKYLNDIIGLKVDVDVDINKAESNNLNLK